MRPRERRGKAAGKPPTAIAVAAPARSARLLGPGERTTIDILPSTLGYLPSPLHSVKAWGLPFASFRTRGAHSDGPNRDRAG